MAPTQKKQLNAAQTGALTNQKHFLDAKFDAKSADYVGVN